MKPQIYIRADGSQTIGLGHLVRCLALAHMLKDEFSITFVCRQAPDTFREEVARHGFDRIVPDSEEDFLRTITPAHTVVLDGYHFNTAYQQKIKAAGAVLVCIDDLHDQPTYADLVINHAPGVSPEDYHAQPYTQFALGPEYALLRPAFLKQARQKRKVGKVGTVLICFGGSDHQNLTRNTLAVVKTFSEFRKIAVITGAAYANADSILSIARNDARIEYLQAIHEDAMLAQMTQADLAIVPSSGILLEALAAGCRIISGMYTENQKFIYQRYRDSKVFEDAEDFSDAALRKAITRSLQQTPSAHTVIDGNSGMRLAKRISQLVTGNSLELTKATDDDLDTTYRWATDPKVRAYSFSQHQITKAEHTAWFTARIREADCLYLVASLRGEPVGSIRFDIRNGEAVISYLVDPFFHGQNFGQALLSKGIVVLLKARTDIRTVTGFVMKENIPSLKAFDKLGFSKSDESDKFKFQKAIA